MTIGPHDLDLYRLKKKGKSCSDLAVINLHLLEETTPPPPGLHITDLTPVGLRQGKERGITETTLTGDTPENPVGAKSSKTVSTRPIIVGSTS